MKISKKEKKHFHYSSRGCCGENFRSVSFLVWSGRKSEHEHEHEDPQKNRHTTENRNHPGHVLYPYMPCSHWGGD